MRSAIDERTSSADRRVNTGVRTACRARGTELFCRNARRRCAFIVQFRLRESIPSTARETVFPIITTAR